MCPAMSGAASAEREAKGADDVERTVGCWEEEAYMPAQLEHQDPVCLGRSSGTGVWELYSYPRPASFLS